MRLFTLVLVALLFCCAGLFAAPPQFVVENRTTPTPVFEVVNKTTPKLHPPGRGTAASPFASSTCPCDLTGLCGCLEGECACPACHNSTAGTPAPRAAPRSSKSPASTATGLTHTLAPAAGRGGGIRYVQQCSGGTCRMVPVYP